MTNKTKHQASHNQQGQSMVEYTLIVVLVVFAFAVAIAATGPAIGNVFSNTVYNLLGTDPNDIKSLPDQNGFWGTVTWVSEQVFEDIPLPTKTPAEPTPIPTAGPSPTSTPVTPTKTPVPSWTPAPSPTPRDLDFVAPWHDSADDSNHWRLDSGVYLGANEGWYGEFFPTAQLNTGSTGVGYLKAIDPKYQYNLKIDYGLGAPIESWPTGHVGNDWGASYRREIYLKNATTLIFRTPNTNNGMRVWILGGSYGGDATVASGRPGSCSQINNLAGTGKVTWGGSYKKSNGTDFPAGSYKTYGDTSAYPNDCLMMDGWYDQFSNDSNNVSWSRTVQPGTYTIMVDFFENTGDASIQLEISAPGQTGNPDNKAIDGSGNPTSGIPDCRWGPVASSNSNSLENMFDDWKDGESFAKGSRCYLELRGSVEIPAGMTDPYFTFWDVWDYRSSGLKAWVELADYDPDGNGVFVRSDLVWKRFDLHQGDTSNFNWTYQRINIRNLLGLASVTGKRIAVRFGMENSNSDLTRLWYIDSVDIDGHVDKKFLVGQSWNLDTPQQADDFITSGRWGLSTEFARGGGGMSWDDSYQANYDKLSNLRWTSGAAMYDNPNLRMHTIEFDGYVDLDDPASAVDAEGDSGDALLSFWHAFNLGKRTNLEIQYTTTLTYGAGDAVVWKTVPDGSFFSRNSDSNTLPKQLSLSFVEVNLQDIKIAEGSGKFRLRFALTSESGGTTNQGWWIDDIQLEREAISRFIAYPFAETVETKDSESDWLLGGDWARVEGGHRPAFGETGYAFHDSPPVPTVDSPTYTRYQPNRTSTVELKGSFDIKNDSTTNPRSPSCTLLPSTLCDEVDNVKPIDPVLTFWWTHDFETKGGESFYLEWKKADDDESGWKELWSYQDSMTNKSNANNSRSRQSLAWERVEVDLRQITGHSSYSNGLPATDLDDDIKLRYRFVTDNNSNDNSNGDGIYLDNIRIEERVKKSFALWGTGISKTVNNAQYPTNEPLIYTTSGFNYVRFVAESEVNGNAWSSMAEFNMLDSTGAVIPRNTWSITYYDSQESSTGNGSTASILDGNTNTIWHTKYSGGSPVPPHEFRLNLGSTQKVKSFKYLPRQDSSQNGQVAKYSFYVSTNGTTWQLASQGTLANTKSEQTVSLQIDYSTNTPPVGGSSATSDVVGNGTVYRDNLDDKAGQITDNWYIGGNWDVIDWERYDGLLSFHDSTSAPVNSGKTPETAPPNATVLTNQKGDSFNVLEMATIIDLRGTDATSKPILTFWQRHAIGSSLDLRVEVAYEDPTTIGTSYCGSTTRNQCYEHLYGWSEWDNAAPWGQTNYNDWPVGYNGSESYQYLWKREIVDLSAYAASGGNSGKRIRIRFVSDTLDKSNGSSSLDDGWYIDNLEIKYYEPKVWVIDKQTGQSFFDAARNTRNWITEGKWGLDPEFFKGSGGGPASFGGAYWKYWIFTESSCNTSNSKYPGCVATHFDNMTNPDTDSKLKAKGNALELNYNWGYNGPAGMTDTFSGIWELTTPVIGTTMNAGTYTFIFTYDEGLRVRYDTYPTAGGLDPTTDNPDPYSPYWNIINDFSYGGHQVLMGTATFVAGKQYKITTQFFERWDAATLILSLGSSSFSFTDSPKQAAGSSFPEVPATPRAQSSMILNGVFDLKDATDPVLQYYTYYENDGLNEVEVSTDGGFLWKQTGLRGGTPTNFWVGNWKADFWDDNPRSGENRMVYNPLNPSVYDLPNYPPQYKNVDMGNDLNFNWNSGTPISGWVSDHFSVQFRRTFHLDAPMTLRFRQTSDDGHRVWINYNKNGSIYYPGCANIGGAPLISGRPTTQYDKAYNDGSYSSPENNGCLMIDDWHNSGDNVTEVTRTFLAGDHEIIIDYFENGGGAKAKFEVFAGTYDYAEYNGTWMPDNGDWEYKINYLGDYAGYDGSGKAKPPIMIRFRLDRRNVKESDNYQQRGSAQTPVNWMESWWLVDISVIEP